MTSASSDGQTAIRTAQRFGEETVGPKAATLDALEDPAACFDWAVIEEGSRLGLRTLTLSRDHGGAGIDLPALGQVVFELARYDVGVAAAFAQTNMVWRLLDRSATDGQREWLVPKFRDDPRCVLAVGISEPDVGSDHVLPYPSARFFTRARRVDEGWELSGTKLFIDNGNRAGIYVILAQTEPERGFAEGSTAFVVPAGAPGLRAGSVFDKMGERLANHAEVILEQCRVGDDAVLGEVNHGVAVLHDNFFGRIALAGLEAVGVAEAAYDLSLAWAREQTEGGRPLLEHDVVAVQVAEWRMRIDAARGLLERTLERLEQGVARPYEEPLGKVFAAEVARAVTSGAMALQGDRAYVRGSGVEKLLRDAMTFLHSDGANKTLLLRAAGGIRELEGSSPVGS